MNKKQVLRLVEFKGDLRVSRIKEWARALSSAAESLRMAGRMEKMRRELDGVDADERVVAAEEEMREAVVRALRAAVEVLCASGYLGGAVGNDFVSNITRPDLAEFCVHDEGVDVTDEKPEI